MPDSTARFALPLLQPGQAQKEMFHNEALTLVDVGLHPVAQTIGDVAPPGSPAIGECWIVGAGATGDWAGQDEAIACWTSGGWRFVAPVVGMAAWLAAAGVWGWYDGAGWREGVMPVSALTVAGEQVLGARQPAIAGPSGGATIDAEARTAIHQMLVMLRNHGLIAT